MNKVEVNTFNLIKEEEKESEGDESQLGLLS